MEETSSVAVLVMLSVFSLLGIIGNSLVLYIYANKKTKTTAGIFIMSLAGTDLFTCLLIVPYTEVVIYVRYKLQYDFVCQTYMFLITCNVPFSAFIMVAIAVDRFFCICYPFLHALNLCRARIIVLCLLALACMFGLITALLHGIVTLEDIVPQGNISQNPSGALNVSTTNTTDERMGNIIYLTEADENENISFKRSFACSNGMSCEKNRTSNISDGISTYVPQEDLIGLCAPTNDVIDVRFANVYQKIYASFYLLSFILVLVLYALIYRSIWKHRAKKRKRKRSSLYPAGIEFSAVETQFTAVTQMNNGHNAEEGRDHAEIEPMQRKRKQAKPMSLKDKTLYANIRTAAMLFVVTVVFLIAFLPAWLMAHHVVPYNEIIFYMYFVYNTANPFIYAFMNKSFRDDLRKILKFA